MSRCFPYPPPGFTVNTAGEAGLIESIKLRKEKKKSEEGKKDSERKKNKNQRRVKEVKGSTEGKKDQNTHKFDIRKGQELLEISDLSEEHAQPTCLYESSTSYESTESTNNRKRQFSVLRNGTMIKIRLPPPKDEYVCSTSGRVDLPTRDKIEFGLKNKQEDHPGPSGRISNTCPGLTLITDEERINLTSVKVDNAFPVGIAPPVPTVPKQSKKYLPYKYLTEDCIWTQLKHTSCEPEDLSWLFCSKNEGKRSGKRPILENNLMTCSSNLCQPSAQYLPEASFYALPYTIPF